MKTPCYPIWNESEVHLSETELRERKLVQRLSSREDVREILLVMTPALKLFQTTGGDWLVKHLSALFHSNLSQISHWAIRIGDNFFELQRADYDHAQTELRVSRWTQERQELISHSFSQGVTALDDPEIRAIGQRHFSKLNRMHINKYDVWKNNCHVAVDSMLHEIGGLSRHRENLKSMEEWTRQFFCESIMVITRLWYRLRGCNEEVIEKYETSMRHTLEVLTPISRHYPKRQWIREDIARTSSSKMSVVGGHWYLSVLESALLLRKRTEYSYFKVGADGKPELKFDLVQEAVKGIWNGDDASKNLAWLKALPWLAAGFVVGTPRWAFAVIYLVCESGRVKLNERSERVVVENRASPDLENTEYSCPDGRKRRGRTSRRKKSKAKSGERDNDRELVERYERRSTSSGVPFFVDHMSNTETWDSPGFQELCLRIKDVPLPKRWQEHQEDDGPLFYVHSVTGEIRNLKPGPSELWVVKKKVETGWVKSSVMPLPAGWELCRSDTGEKFYLNHNDNPPNSTSMHPIAQEIADERKVLLPEWNVEWDEERGKKYRNMETHEIRWKKIDGRLYDPEIARPKIDSSQSRRAFVEPLPAGWLSTVDNDGRVVYVNEVKMERRTSHPYNDKRRRLLPQWEMRYTAASRRYWVHYGQGSRGSTWWTRNKLVKNTSLNNNACGWKQARNGEWEWFEGGDAPHSGIPMLDLNDPADFEFREYPFISPRELQTSDGHFLEPLPHDWILQPIEGGVKYYYNFRTKTPSSEHPYEKERQDLPALWEMRWTRYGKQYYINHGTGLTWWTNPRMDKHKQKLRAYANQKQDGWKWDEDEDCWERFSEIPLKESVGEASPNQTDSDISSTDGDSEKETRQILAQTREWLKEVNAEELLGEIQSQLRERGSQKLSSTTQWLKDRGGKIGEDEKVKKMRHWMKERSASETLGTLKKEVKARRSYLHSLSMHSVSRGGNESAKDPEDLEPEPDGTDGTMLQTSDLPTPAHHENEYTAGDYFQLGGSTVQSAAETLALDTGEVPKTSENVEVFHEDVGGVQSVSEKEDPELLPSDSLETPPTKKKEKLSIIGQHIKENRNMLTRHASGILTQRKAEMEERWRSTVEKKRLASERKLPKDGKLGGEEILPADNGVELPDDEHGAQDSVMRTVRQETAEATSVDSKVPEGQNRSSDTQMDSAEEPSTGEEDDQSPTVIDLSPSSTIAPDVGSLTEGGILSKYTVGADKEPSLNYKSFLGTVNALLGADSAMESVAVKAESGRKKWLKKAWAKV
ncbi:hypothetical protein MMC14_003117 [Varicellaria rhodocarpa]|nr:hypothetical protein [Varicellaria rhodocarpa]